MIWGAIIGAAVAAAGMYVNYRQQKKQNQANRDLAAFQAQANDRYQDKQNAYNAPINQMDRFKAAGLNEHLIYGQGSPGNQSSPQTYPDIKPVDYQKQNLDALIPIYNQSRLADAQVQAQNASTRQKYSQVQLNELQARVIAKNPLLDDEGFKAIIDGLKSTAELKAFDAEGQKISNFVNQASSGHQVSKVFHEVELLEQRFRLGEKDSAIKAEVLKSKEFQNAILDVQKKFMTDGEVTPQHVLQFIQLLLLKAL